MSLITVVPLSHAIPVNEVVYDRLSALSLPFPKPKLFFFLGQPLASQPQVTAKSSATLSRSKETNKLNSRAKLKLEDTGERKFD
jgi:hypothetical protein